MYLFVYLFLAVRVFLHCGLFLVAPSGGLLSSFGARASYCGGFSCCERGLQGVRTSVVGSRMQGLQWLQLSSTGSTGTWPQLFRCMGNLPGSGIEPVSPTLAGR